MRTKFLLSGVLGMILAFSVSCNRQEEVKVIDKEQVKAEIQAVEDGLANAYNLRSLDSLNYYADSAISYFAGESPIVGKEAIHAHINNEFKELPVGSMVSFKTIDIYVSADGNNVAEIGEFKQVDSTGALLYRGHYFGFFAKRNGKYLCVRDMTNSAPLDSE